MLALEPPVHPPIHPLAHCLCIIMRPFPALAYVASVLAGDKTIWLIPFDIVNFWTGFRIEKIIDVRNFLCFVVNELGSPVTCDRELDNRPWRDCRNQFLLIHVAHGAQG